jgi:glycosyltransferase involved in cell wall biosynthesis
VQVLCGGDWEVGSRHWNGYSDEFYHGVNVRRLNLNWTLAPHPFRYLYDNPITATYLADFLREERPDLVHVTSCDTLSASVLRVIKEAGLPLILSLTDFWFLCPRWNLLRSDGENCNGITTPWDCLKCNLHGGKIYRWSSSILPESFVAPLLSSASKYPLLARQRGLRGLAGDMAERKAYLRSALALPDVRITASTFVREVLLANGIEVPIIVRPYGHDLSWLDRYTGKTDSQSIRFGFIGQISYSKGIHLLLQAMRSLSDDSFESAVQCLIYGSLEHDLGYSAYLFELASDSQNMRFCGTYVHSDSARVFADLDVLVVPSLWFDFPLVIYEAFATGTPVITADLGSMAEAVKHDVNGLLFTRGDYEHLTRQMRRLLEEPGLLSKLQFGIKPVKSIQEEVDELETTYYQLTVQQ